MNLVPLITLFVLIALGIIAWLYISKTNSRIASWKLVTLSILGGILIFFLLGSPSENVTSTNTAVPTDELPAIQELSWLQLIFTGAGLLLFIVGAHVVIYFHNQRLSKRWWSIFNPLQTPYKDFNRREWIQFGAVLALSFSLMVLGVNLGHIR